MPSTTHQTLLLWAIRKMTADGYTLLGKDGTVPGITTPLPQPPVIKNVRPDACGQDPTTGRFALGEAKTAADIATPHTKQQLQVFANTIHNDDGRQCRLYVAVPRSASTTLDRVLGTVGLLGAPQVVRLHIPDCLIREEAR
jgi:hypothetical protein